MAILAPKLALRHAPTVTTTIREQCRGYTLKIKRVDSYKGKPHGARFLPIEKPKNAREDAHMKEQRRLQAKQSGEHSDEAASSASKSSIHDNPALKIAHQPRLYKYDGNRWLTARKYAEAQDGHKPKESLSAVQRTTRKDTSAGNVRIRPVVSSHKEPEPRNLDEELRTFDEELRSALNEYEYPLEAGTSGDITTGMFSPTKPRQSKSSPRRHLTPDILTELLGESGVAEPAQSSIPPLNLTPESVGLPPDVSWKPLAEKDHQSFIHSDHTQNGTSSEPLVSRLRDTATVLVLSCASRTLALSDFMRLSPQGEHIEGWTSGIVRVIPGRNPTTLERTNHYFLVFSTSAAAAGYAENIDRLHMLSKKWTPDRPQHLGTPAPGVEIGDRGEDVGALVRSFTLLPNTQPRVYIRRMQKPYRPAIARVIETGAYHNILAQEKDKAGENLVLFQLDDGLMSGNDLMKVIEADGRRRNLNWRLEGNVEGDIVHYGGGGKNDASRDGADWEDMEGGDVERRQRKSHPRHIVRFRDAVEAKRFVRAWHSRVLEGEPWETLAAKGHWTGGKVSAEILW